MALPSAPLTLRDFQREDVDRIAEADHRALIASAPGTGKTIVCLSAIAEQGLRLLPALIVCPASVVFNWKIEARQWAPGVRVHCVEDTTSKIPQLDFGIYVISWALLTLRWQEFARREIRIIVGDEIHYAKNKDALRSQAMFTLASQVQHMLLLSGTPIVNDTDELDAIKSLFGERKFVMLRRLLEDVAPDIPPKERSYVRAQLPRHIATRYRSAEEDFASWLERELAKRMDDGEAEEAASRALAAEGLIKIGYLRRILAAGKIYAAADLAGRLVRMGEPVVIFAEHKAVVRGIQKLLIRQRVPYVTVDGAAGPRARAIAVQKFQKNKVPIFIGSKAAKEGLTLHAARHLIFVERYWTPAEEEQAEDRIRRIGQKFRTKVWFVTVEGTVDNRIDQIIDRKRQIVRSVIGAKIIAETPEGVVADLISSWGKFVLGTTETSKGVGHEDLGTPVAQLPPLPRKGDVAVAVFKKPRWRAKTAMRWMRMLGYDVDEVQETDKGWRVVSVPLAAFSTGSFRPHPITKDLILYIGSRNNNDDPSRDYVPASRKSPNTGTKKKV
jgi:SNF2 family DNA or RNA helicase